MAAMKPDEACACGSGRSYRQCCGILHGGGVAADAQALMRSRYCAYVLRLWDYLLATWHPRTRPAELGDPQAAQTRWLGLAIKRHERIDADHAVVEFVARFRLGGAPAVRMRETSHFVREDGRWYYLDGELDGAQVGERKRSGKRR